LFSVAPLFAAFLARKFLTGFDNRSACCDRSGSTKPPLAEQLVRSEGRTAKSDPFANIS
jgi:hypothetical protein